MEVVLWGAEGLGATHAAEMEPGTEAMRKQGTKPPKQGEQEAREKHCNLLVTQWEGGGGGGQLMSLMAAIVKRFVFPQRGCKVANFMTSLLNFIFTSSGYLRKMRQRSRKGQSESQRVSHRAKNINAGKEGGKVCVCVCPSVHAF